MVGEDETVVSESTEGTATSAWPARAIPLRKVGERDAFVRHSSEAFEDADNRMSLELKYYFELPATKIDSTEAIEGPLAKGPKLEPGEKLAAGPEVAAEPWAKSLPMSLDTMDTKPGFDIEFLDYVAGAKAKTIATLLPAADGQEKSKTTLLVARVAEPTDGLQINKAVAAREIDSRELPQGCVPGGLLDAWDRPKTLGTRAMFVGRVIAVLKQIEGRYAVDFFGDTLNQESDCRVWLWREGDALGRPVGIRFAEIPIKKGPTEVSNVWALAVTVRGADDSLRTIAFDYPLCRPAVMAQMQRAASTAGGGKPAASPDLEKVVGADLLDEFSRRLVNGTYK